MYMKIENIPSCKIVYLRQVGPYGTRNKEVMEELKNWAKSNDLLNKDSIILGIAQDDPNRTAPENCRYDSCIVVPQSYTPTDKSIHSGSISGGKYAVFKIEHTKEALIKGWKDIFPELTSRNYQLDGTRPVLERYIMELVENHHCEICVPVK